MTFCSRILLFALALAAGASLAAAGQTAAAAGSWPAWRGPEATGVSPGGTPPLTWSEQSNVRFKVRLPGRGLASPIVWDDRIFILASEPVDHAAYARSRQAAEEKQKRRQWPPAVTPVRQRFLVLAYSRADGHLLWRRTAAETVPTESHYIDASWASASPVTDGKRLIAHFGSNGTYAYDLDGHLLWKTDLGDMRTRNGFGEGSSPVLHGDTVVINWDHEGDSFIVALDADTGKPRWRDDRPGEVTSWSTPLIVVVSGKPQVVVSATGKSRGYDLETGEQVWQLGGMSTNTIPSPAAGDGIVYLLSGYRDTIVQAVSLARARGDLENSDAVLWTYEKNTPYVPSPLLYDGRLYFLKSNRNILSDLDAATGAPHFTERLPAIHTVYASPVGAAGRVYVFDRDGHATVLRHGPTFEIVAENSLDDGVDASPAIAGPDLIVRGHEYLYCLSSMDGGNVTSASATPADDHVAGRKTGAQRH